MTSEVSKMVCTISIGQYGSEIHQFEIGWWNEKVYGKWIYFESLFQPSNFKLLYLKTILTHRVLTNFRNKKFWWTMIKLTEFQEKVW